MPNRSRLSPLSLAFAATVAVLAIGAPAALAFTVDDGSGNMRIPKFDLEEQAKNFRTRDLGAATTRGRTEVETPVGKLQFGVQQGGSSFDMGGRANDRRHYDRLFSPDYQLGR